MRNMIFRVSLVITVFAGNVEIAQAAEVKVTPAADCRNVSSTQTVDSYITNFYLTTWGSASAEGSAQGFGEGLTGQGRAFEAVRQAMLRPQKTQDGLFNELPRSFKPYCRIYDAGRPDVAKAVAEILPSLGNPIITSNQRSGIFATDFIQRQHPAARWRDSYVITVTEEGPDRVVVRVLRTVYISRDGTTFNQGIPDGHNEKWILTQIGNKIR